MAFPDVFWAVVSIAVLVLLVAALDTLHGLRRDLARMRRLQNAPEIEAQDRPRPELVA